MIRVQIAPGRWLSAPAAAAYIAARSAGCPAGITDAGRDPGEQIDLYNRWLVGDFDAPSVARPGTSKHEAGNALDLPPAPAAWMRKHGIAHGWHADRVKREPWHFEWEAPPANPNPNPNRGALMILYSYAGQVFILHSLGLTPIDPGAQLSVTQAGSGAPIDLDAIGYEAVRQVAEKLIEDSATNLKGQNIEIAVKR